MIKMIMIVVHDRQTTLLGNNKVFPRLEILSTLS